jgi:hypothetical protein
MPSVKNILARATSTETEVSSSKLKQTIDIAPYNPNK